MVVRNMTDSQNDEWKAPTLEVLALFSLEVKSKKRYFFRGTGGGAERVLLLGLGRDAETGG
jgi:hypothetical protein